MTFKKDLEELKKRKGKKIPIATKADYVSLYRRPAKSSKPNLIDPNAKDGPVKIFTREEIEEYEKRLLQN
jgi:hypothetical protein